jgi:RNA polymerase sigma-70 factor, ECF subfamily
MQYLEKDYSTLTNEELLGLYARNSNSAAIEELFNRYSETAVRIARRFTRSSDVDDSVQNAFLSVLRHAKAFRSSSNVKTWLVAIIINSCRTHYRNELRRKTVESNASRESETQDTNELDELKVLTSQHTRTLSAIYREPLVNRYYEGLTVHQISKSLNLPINTVRNRIYRGVQHLRKSLLSNRISVQTTRIVESS